MRACSKFAAILLIALALSPFTAPFSSCDLATLVGDGTPVTSEGGASKDATMAGAIVEAPARIDDHATVLKTVHLRIVPTAHTAPIILRI